MFTQTQHHLLHPVELIVEEEGKEEEGGKKKERGRSKQSTHSTRNSFTLLILKSSSVYYPATNTAPNKDFQP